MMQLPFVTKFRAFAADNRGTVAVVDFAVMLPIFLTMFLSGVEMGMMTVRQTLMESALDRAVRDVRIGTGQEVTHDWLRKRICDYAGLLPDCESALKLELRSTDLRTTSSTLGDTPDCINRNEELNPVVAFNNGQRSEMMLMRACFVFSPIFPNVGFGYNSDKNAAGDVALYATTAFVNEPG
ncbi:MAG: pilus assembly protein [Pseudooceanicola sp.]|nr:pilus assembly protein [Pseudooceanicola sp.]